MRHTVTSLLFAVLTLAPALGFAGSANVSWLNNTEPDLAGYRVFYGFTAGNYINTLDVGNVTAATLINLDEEVTYYITVAAYDQDGNQSNFSTVQSVYIPLTDTTPPTITVPLDITIEATGPTTPVNLGIASAVDAVDGTVTVTPDNSGPFAPGLTVVTWSATDAAGNLAQATQRVTVVDTTGPTIIAAAITVEATGTLTSVDLTGVSASDLVDGTLVVTPDTSGPFLRGISTIVWTATDSHGNTRSVNQTITVQDTTPPNAPSGLSVTAN